MDDSLKGGKSNACHCGFSTSSHSYMLLHLSEGNCQPSDAQCMLVRVRLSEIHTSRMALVDTIQKLQDEEVSLGGILALAAKPITKAAKARSCNVCKKLTNDLFGDVPQCGKHTGGKSEMIVKGRVFNIDDRQKRAVSDIVENLLHGTDH